MIRSLSKKYKYDGRQLEFIRKYVDANAKEVKVIGKHKYLIPLTKKARRKLKKYAQEYPKEYDDFDKETDVKNLSELFEGFDTEAYQKENHGNLEHDLSEAYGREFL